MRKNLLWFLTSTIIISSIFILKTTSFSLNNENLQHDNFFKLNNDLDKVPLCLYVNYLEDKQDNLDIESLFTKNISNKLNWIKSKSKVLNFGFSDSTYWINLKVKNSSNEIIDWALEFDYPLIDYIDIYVVKNNKIINTFNTGDHRKFDTRDIFYRNIIKKLNFKPGLYNLYFKFKTKSSMNVSIYGWTLNNLYKKINIETFLLGIFFGFMIIFIFYNLILYFPLKDINYIIYILWVLGYGMYLLSIAGLSHQFLWSEYTFWSDYSIPFFIFFASFLTFQFTRSFLNTKKILPKIDKYLLIGMGLTILLSIFTFTIEYKYIIRIAVSSIFILTISILSISIACLKKGYKPARLYLIAWSFLLASIVIYALKAFGFLLDNIIFNWSQHLATGFEVLLLSFALSDRISQIENEKNNAIKTMNVNLKKHVKQLNSTNLKLALSEDRYKLLIEGSNDYIFILDENWNIISTNKSFNSHFKLNTEDLKNKNLLDLIYETDYKRNVTKKLILDKLNLLKKDREPIEFKTNFISSIKNEPEELKVKLQYTNIVGKNQIIGRAYSELDDYLLKYFISEKKSLYLDNYLKVAEDMCYRITRNLSKYLDLNNTNLIRIAIREILINAIEHGNLNVSFDEKTESMANDKYFELIAERRDKKDYKNRRVSVDYNITPEYAEFNIKDEGEGFNHKQVLKDAMNFDPTNLLPHGRGLIMVNNIFDQISFNKIGNKVKLVKYYKNQKNISQE